MGVGTFQERSDSILIQGAKYYEASAGQEWIPQKLLDRNDQQPFLLDVEERETLN